MLIRRIAALATAILTVAAIIAAAPLSQFQSVPAALSHHFSVPAGSSTGTVHILAGGGVGWS